MQSKPIVSIAADRLIAHPANPNRMAAAVYKKLVTHIERTGNYEPIVVRNHPDCDGHFEILNGHHRLKAISQIGHEVVDCVVWEVDDDEADMLLLTLNRLQGSDDTARKSALIKRLSESYDSKSLARRINESKKTIERLKEFTPSITKLNRDMPTLLNAVVFYLSDEQKAVVTNAIAAATEKDWPGSSAQKKAKAITAICQKIIEQQTQQPESLELR